MVPAVRISASASASSPSSTASTSLRSATGGSAPRNSRMEARSSAWRGSGPAPVVLYDVAVPWLPVAIDPPVIEPILTPPPLLGGCSGPLSGLLDIWGVPSLRAYGFGCQGVWSARVADGSGGPSWWAARPWLPVATAPPDMSLMKTLPPLSW